MNLGASDHKTAASTANTHVNGFILFFIADKAFRDNDGTSIIRL